MSDRFELGSKSPDEHELVLAPTQLEELRAIMRAAPYYDTDAATTTDSFVATHEYGIYPATANMAGRIVTEIKQPTETIIQRDLPEYNGSDTEWRYQESNAFDGWMASPIGVPLHTLGFRSATIPTGDKNSKLIVVEYPSAEELTKKVQAAGNDAVSFVAQDTDYRDAETRVAALAEGKVLLPETPRQQASFMQFNASMWSLLSPEFVKLLRFKAELALDAQTPAFHWTAAPDALGSYRVDNIKHFDGTMHSIVGLIMAGPLNAAFACESEDYVPSPIDDLGYRLRDTLETEVNTLPDHGRLLAEIAVVHLQKLSQAA